MDLHCIVLFDALAVAIYVFCKWSIPSIVMVMFHRFFRQLLFNNASERDVKEFYRATQNIFSVVISVNL